MRRLTVHGDGSDGVLSQVHRALEDEATSAKVLDLEGVEDGRDILGVELQRQNMSRVSIRLRQLTAWLLPFSSLQAPWNAGPLEGGRRLDGGGGGGGQGEKKRSERADLYVDDGSNDGSDVPDLATLLCLCSVRSS